MRACAWAWLGAGGVVPRRHSQRRKRQEEEAGRWHERGRARGTRAPTHWHPCATARGHLRARDMVTAAWVAEGGTPSCTGRPYAGVRSTHCARSAACSTARCAARAGRAARSAPCLAWTERGQEGSVVPASARRRAAADRTRAREAGAAGPSCMAHRSTRGPSGARQRTLKHPEYPPPGMAPGTLYVWNNPSPRA